MKKTVIAILLAVVALLAFRSLVMTIYTIEGAALEPLFESGDRILVNRWSYGLRTGSIEGLFGYGRIGSQMPSRGDIIAFDDPSGSGEGVFLGRVTSLPGDTVTTRQGTYLVPGEVTCANQNYYMVDMGKDGLMPVAIPETCIIGRVILIVYNHDDKYPVMSGYAPKRWCLLP